MESSSPEISANNNEIDVKTSSKRMKGSKEDGFSCDQCDFTSMYSSNLSQHIKSKHEGIRYHCDQCDYASTTSSDLKQH